MAKEKFDFVAPIKDIPKALKGFPKNLIRIWKEPVTNSEEVVARRKEIYPMLYLFVAVFVLMAVLVVVIPPLEFVFTILCLIPGFGAAACGFLLVVLQKAAQKFADLECDQCKKRIAFDENVQIKVIKRTFTVFKDDKTIRKNDIPVESTIKAIGKERVVLEITCKCQECGAEKTFTHEFVTVECEKGAVKVPYVQSGALLVQFEQDVRNEGAEGFEGKTVGTTANGVHIRYIRTLESLVQGYFGNQIQMR